MYNIDKLQGEWKKLEESFGNETPSVDPANDMPILDPANENPMVKYNRAIRDWKVWVAGHPNEVPPPRPKRPAQVGPSQPKMGWKRGGQAVWNKLHEGYKELNEVISTYSPDTLGAHSKLPDDKGGKEYAIPALASSLAYVVTGLLENPHATIPDAYRERLESLIRELDAHFRKEDKKLHKVDMHDYKSDAWVDK